jgi:hypothetical protein
MNRSILIVICDFLLLSLVVFSSLDVNRITEEKAPRTATAVVATNQPAPKADRDLAAVMRVALEDERKSRELLMSELDRARQSVAERERQVRGTQEELRAREEQARRLAEAQTNLLTQFTAAQTNIQQLTAKLSATSTEAVVSKERLSALEAEIKKRAEEAAAMQERLSAMAKSNQLAAAERQELAGKLQTAEVERRHAFEQVTKMTEQVKVEREERTKLAEGVKDLASQSGELAKEVREHRPMPPNMIFNEFAENRVQARIAAFRPGFIADTNRRRDTETVLITDGTNTFAVCHVTDTPMALTIPGTQWESLQGVLAHGLTQLPIRSISFHRSDPRLVFIALTAEEAKRLGAKPFSMVNDPFKFQDVVLVGTQEAYYGECRFQIDLSTPGYLRLDNSFIRGLFGKFNPSRGDLVFSKSGEVLGVMVNGSYCYVLRGFQPGAVLQFGKDVRAQQTGNTLSTLAQIVMGFPQKLQ